MPRVGLVAMERRERRAPRVVPRAPVTVNIVTEGGPVAFGVVANISPLGACLLTDLGFASGTPLQLTLSFPGDWRPVGVRARIAWAQLQVEGEMRCGLEFDALSERDAAWLSTLIGKATFH